MSKRLIFARLLLGIYVCLAISLEPVFGDVGDRGPLPFLTEPSDRDPLVVCQNYLMETRSQKGLLSNDISNLAIAKRFTNKHNGVTHIYFKQYSEGIEVHGGSYSAAVDKRGRLITEGDKLKRRLQQRKNRQRPVLTAEQALRSAALNLGLDSNAQVEEISTPSGAMRKTRFRAYAISRDEIPARLVFVETGDVELKLSWNLVIRTPDGRDWWNVFIDSTTGELLKKINWVVRESYNVFPLPNESPTLGPRTIVSAVADPLASPFGWHDTNGVAGAEFNDTRGNNVFAQEDTDGDDLGGVRPSGGPTLIFDPVLNSQLQPSANQAPSIVNLFYWNNIIHDVLYQYGFDEQAGNFQQNNYAKGGVGGDPVFADAQDGIDVNNAQFGTPPEGAAPRMEMFLWDASQPTTLEITAPANVAGSYGASSGAFGAWTNGLNGTVVLAIDAANAMGPSTTDGCSTFDNANEVAGNIAMVDRGDCLFIEKTANAQAAGAIGIIIINNAGDDLINMAGEDPSLTIPPIFIGQTDGAALKAQANNGLTASLTVGERRDAAFDNGVIAHEYAHGLTNRLTGGASDTNCLANAQPRGMGEGWSDWFALTMTATPSDSPIVARAIGTYASGEPIDGPGIRNHPYSRNMGVSPLVFSDMGSLNRPHGVGEIWASALWDLYWNLVDAYGFDEDLYAGSGGNNILMQLVIDALKLQPCNPNFLEARDSIITADLISNQGANQCLIWEAFARRGMGESAVAFNSNAIGGTEAFDVPSMCTAQCGNGMIDVGEQCDDGNNLSFDGCAANCRVETDLAELFGSADGGGINLVLNGVSINTVTTEGQSAAQAASALAAAINTNTALQAISSVAVSAEGNIVVTGAVESFEINDPGLTSEPEAQQVPIDQRWLALLVVLLVAVSSRFFRSRDNF